MYTICLADKKYEFDVDDHGLLAAARRHGAPWPAGMELQHSNAFMAALARVNELQTHLEFLGAASEAVLNDYRHAIAGAADAHLIPDEELEESRALATELEGALKQSDESLEKAHAFILGTGVMVVRKILSGITPILRGYKATLDLLEKTRGSGSFKEGIAIRREEIDSFETALGVTAVRFDLSGEVEKPG